MNRFDSSCQIWLATIVMVIEATFFQFSSCITQNFEKAIFTSYEGSQLHIWLIVFRECNDANRLQSHHTDSFSRIMCIYSAVSLVTHIATSPRRYCVYHTFIGGKHSERFVMWSYSCRLLCGTKCSRSLDIPTFESWVLPINSRKILSIISREFATKWRNFIQQSSKWGHISVLSSSWQTKVFCSTHYS